PMATPIWLDCDTGHDDAFAILLAAHHPDVHLLGISTIYGNAPLDKTTYNTRAILKAIGREDIPVYPGAAHPFCRPVVYAPDIHGESGLDGTTVLPAPTVPVRTDRTAVEAMYAALISTPKGTAWIVPTGALTTTALLLATHPDLIEHIAGLSIMGGAVGNAFTNAPTPPDNRVGNITPWAEFNIYIDPESAKSVFSKPVLAAKTTLITLDLTHQFLATQEVQSSLLAGSSASSSSSTSNTRKLFAEILAFFAKTYAEIFAITSGPPVHDPLAVAAAFLPHLFFDSLDSTDAATKPVRYVVDVITEGAHSEAAESARAQSQCGRTVVAPVAGGGPGVRIPRGVAKEEVWKVIGECLARGEAALHAQN
ncbi:Inosine/uridine-preferring nucleoside hydrolase domain-containing protein, partial [Neohortaea acidophila]